MEDWKSRYSDKVCTADEAVLDVKHGHRVFIGSGAGQPESLVEALTARHDIEDTEIVHIMTLGIAPYVERHMDQRFRHNAFFIGPNVREAVSEGRADYTPIFLSEIPHLFRSGRIMNDVALVQVSPPDEHGYCSFGVSTDIVKSAAESARRVICEVNSNTPRSLGDCFINVRDVHRLVPSDRPILEAPQGEPDDLARDIAKYIADLIEDGATIQLGIGTIPDAVLHFLTDRRDLGIHTEMFSDGVIPLIEQGVITNNRKTLHRGKIIASFVLGSRKLYDFIDNNPLVEFHPTEYTNDPFIIAQNHKMVSINSALEIDLTGQVCADSLGTMFYSGIGGQVDFVRGASRAKGGKAIIALPSTAAGGTVSRIVPTLKPGAGVVTSRGDVHYVVTEFGVAYLHGKTIRERALALIQIAHPKFRPWLMAEAKARHMVYADQLEMPIEMPLYPDEFEREIELEDGSVLWLRPLKITDEPRMREMFYTLSDESVYHRFFQAIKALPHAKLQKLMKVDYKTSFSLVASVEGGEDAPIVGVGHYVVDPKSNLAEVAFLVADDYQDRGIGSELLLLLTEAAKANGVRGFTAMVMADNIPMQRVFHKTFDTIESRFEGDVYVFTIEFDPKVE
ncbi:MAG: GNAT family N-acetyltransferase [Candidatus Latescibacterota bacterium]|jgi:acyl-CoA hydrolase/RimJ/RimL family protein N-acetyltransferase